MALVDAKKTVELKWDWSKGYSRLDAAHLNLNHCKDVISAYKKGHEYDPNNKALKSKHQGYGAFILYWEHCGGGSYGGSSGCREGGGGGCHEGSDGYSCEGGGDSDLTGVRETCDCLVTSIR